MLDGLALSRMLGSDLPRALQCDSDVIPLFTKDLQGFRARGVLVGLSVRDGWKDEYE